MYKDNNARFYKGDFVATLLDSKLITPTQKEKYNIKLIDCGDYIQVYYYCDDKYRNTKEKFDDTDLYKSDKSFVEKVKFDSKHIEFRNIIRSKLSCQRIAKANSKEWKSFITLTYSNNMQDIKKGKNDLSNYIDKVKRVFKDFKYIAIPEFQKRGAVHFHLLTNIECGSDLAPRREKKYLYNPISKTSKELEYYDLPYWSTKINNEVVSLGFTSAEPLDGDCKKIVGYISKYMTEDCDDRLFMVRRYTTSQNLIKPEEHFFDVGFRYDKNKRYYNKFFKDTELIYENLYLDKFGNEVQFMEFLKVNIRRD